AWSGPMRHFTVFAVVAVVIGILIGSASIVRADTFNPPYVEAPGNVTEVKFTATDTGDGTFVAKGSPVAMNFQVPGDTWLIDNGTFDLEVTMDNYNVTGGTF